MDKSIQISNVCAMIYDFELSEWINPMNLKIAAYFEWIHCIYPIEMRYSEANINSGKLIVNIIQQSLE
ncbi:hypothetical protein A8709_12185 [Paenibacillus pectinilyticus]|uniref:Uncharacterized protein n=1 Tax=Paenibacillus pectinilyticus TaxID=512399 RepID=A0A1C1A2W9_9BACL|nr:hypothetical protein A8709_12185 [Paenibacillus pectinilyticus]